MSRYRATSRRRVSRPSVWHPSVNKDHSPVLSGQSSLKVRWGCVLGNSRETFMNVIKPPFPLSPIHGYQYSSRITAKLQEVIICCDKISIQLLISIKISSIIFITTGVVGPSCRWCRSDLCRCFIIFIHTIYNKRIQWKIVTSSFYRVARHVMLLHD